MRALDKKICKNALIGEKLLKLSMEDKQKIVKRLLTGYTEKQLSEEVGIPYSTLHDWKTLRQNNKGEQIHISLAFIYRKLKNIDPKKITDWGRIKMIKERIDEILEAEE